MSNTKWEKFFKAVANSDISFSNETVKCLADECIRSFSLERDALSYNRYVTADSIAGPFDYKYIEWIFVPAVRVNDIPALKKLIDGLGLYEYDFDENGLKIYGYK